MQSFQNKNLDTVTSRWLLIYIEYNAWNNEPKMLIECFFLRTPVPEIGCQEYRAYRPTNTSVLVFSIQVCDMCRIQLKSHLNNENQC
jgi:hypothetical protein